MQTLKALYLEELAEMRLAEQQMIPALAEMAKATSSTRLRQLLESHVKSAEDHLKQMEMVFDTFSRMPSGDECDAAAGLLKNADEIASLNQTVFFATGGRPAAKAADDCLDEEPALAGRDADAEQSKHHLQFDFAGHQPTHNLNGSDL